MEHGLENQEWALYDTVGWESYIQRGYLQVIFEDENSLSGGEL